MRVDFVMPCINQPSLWLLMNVCGLCVDMQVSGGFYQLLNSIDAILKKVCSDQSIAKNASVAAQSVNGTATVLVGTNITYSVTV